MLADPLEHSDYIRTFQPLADFSGQAFPCVHIHYRQRPNRDRIRREAPGAQLQTVTVQANFRYQTIFVSKGPVAYETLLLDSMRGYATLFTRRDEVEAEWRIITPIEEA